MSKNLTRKGLALGAVVALGSSLFAGTPATAAPTALYLDTAFGTSGATQTGLLGQYFVLAGSAAGAATNDVVKYYIEGAAAADISVRQRNTTDLTTENANSTVYGNAATPTNTDAAALKATVSTTWTAGSYAQIAIKLGSGVTANTTLKVTPFLDSVIADNKPGANELTGSPVTINFVKGADLTATPTITTSTLGVAAKATVAVSGGLNLSQYRGTAKGGFGESGITVQFKKDGSNDGAVATALWDTTDSVFVATAPNTTAAGSTYGATALINAVESASATAVAAAAGEVSSLADVSFSKSTSFRASKGTGSNTDNVVRAGSGSFTAKTTVTAVSGKKASGQTVTFTISEASDTSLPTGATVSAGSKTLTATAAATESISVDVVSDADGVATLPISYAGVTDAKTFTVKASAKGASAAVNSNTVTVTGQDSYAIAIVDTLQQGSAVRRVAKGATYSIPFTVVDQFGQTPTGTFRVVVTNNGSSNTTTAINSPVAVSAGKVTVTGTDTSTADGSYTVTATLQKLGSDGSTYAGITNAVSATSSISVGTVGTPSSVSIVANAGTTSVTRALSGTLVSGNTDLEQSSVDRTVAGGTNVTATVKNVAGGLVAGVSATYSAAGVLFKSGNNYGLGSLTVQTDANGTTGAVYAYSNLSGEQTITVTSGSASGTIKVTFAAAVSTTGSAWTVTAPSSILPGQTLKVSAVLKDKYGVVVQSDASKVKIVYTGAGFVTATLPTATDVDGVVSFNVLLGSADAGTSTVKFIYAGANGTLEETTSNDDVVANASIVIGAAPATAATAAVSGSKGKFFVSATNAAAKKVVVKVAGKFFGSFTGTAAKKSVALKAPKGSHKVTVFVGGKLVATKTISVK